jgi:uncharacterized protein
MPHASVDETAYLEPRCLYITQLILKVASRCNLNCSYCYVYNKGDSAWMRRPPVMSTEVFEAALERIRRHCHFTGQRHLLIAFHGGEPCLIGPARLDAWCTRARQVLEGATEVRFSIQTNGTLLDDSWAEVFRKHDVQVGVSLDGPKQENDVFRVSHTGQGSYDQVARGLEKLQEAHVSYGILCVIPLGADPLSVHRHFLALGSSRVTYLLPHFTHDTIAPIRQRYGPTPCADFLTAIFDEWWFNGTMDVRVGDLWNMARIILGGSSEREGLGNTPPRYVFIETDGDIEGLDNLKVCRDGITRIGLNVMAADFQQILQTDTMHGTAIFQGMPLPHACRGCPEADTCAGGYLPHRYSSASGFDNPSVWCADLLKLFTHVRFRMGVTVEDTHARRRALEHGAVTQTALWDRSGGTGAAV